MSWYVIQTAPQKEFEAAKALRAIGYTVFVPWREVGKGRQIAWFPRYIFVHFWIPWREINYRDDRCVRDKFGRPMLTGTITVCGSNESIPENVISRIATDSAMERIEDKATAPMLKPGDIGIIKHGAFEGKSGTIETIDGDEAEVATRIFNAVRTVKVPVDHLEAAA